ncbi:MAG: 4-hydroxy-tetrahydrodipicolinate synthase [Methylohalobius sp.]|nr:4-hydroxy-tetrahydrodipicolinate synthase [Methylohalobius sp.]
MIKGSIVALVTPMNADGSLNDAVLRELVEFHIEQGTDAIVAVGTTGEAATLDYEEHCQVIRWVVEQARGRLPVIAGTGSNCTREAIELTQKAKDLGADACLLVTPYYNKPTQEGLYQHFKAVAEAVAIPQILYNVPSRCGCDLLPETVARLSLIPNIVGLKEACADPIARARQIRDLCPGFPIYSGDDASARQLCLEGGAGVISVTANVAPRLMHRMILAALAGDAEQAAALDNRLTGLHRALFLESNPIPVKWALNALGKIPEGIRLPLTWLAPQYQPEVRQALLAAGVL